jgi:hypothetical protein
MKTTHIGGYESEQDARHMADSCMTGAVVQLQDDGLWHVFQIDSWTDQPEETK